MQEQTWIKGEEIRKMLQERIQSIESRVALPDYILSNSSVIDDLYAEMQVDTSRSFLNNVINITRHEVLLDLQKLNQRPEPEKDWLMQPLVSNAYFDAMNDNISKKFSFFIAIFLHFLLFITFVILT
jgi:predicted metalloendopeptidase